MISIREQQGLAAPSGPAGQGLRHPTASLGQGLMAAGWAGVGSWAMSRGGEAPCEAGQGQ